MNILWVSYVKESHVDGQNGVLNTFTVYEVEMEEDLASDTSGYFRRLMISLVSAGRQEDIYANVDYDKAREDAQKFLDVSALHNTLLFQVAEDI